MNSQVALSAFLEFGFKGRHQLTEGETTQSRGQVHGCSLYWHEKRRVADRMCFSYEQDSGEDENAMGNGRVCTFTVEILSGGKYRV